MRPRIPLQALLGSLLLASCASTGLPSGETIGESIESQEVVRFSVVDAGPADHFDRILLVEAEVTEVCRVGHCWMQITDGGKTALVRWETGCGGQYEFPEAAIGKRVLIQGSFYPKELDADEREHLVGESGGGLEIRPDPYEFNASAILILDEQ
jgi:hypothetical protein